MPDWAAYLDTPWRLGQHRKRNVYAVIEYTEDRKSDPFLGMFEDAVIATHVVETHNAWLAGRRMTERSSTEPGGTETHTETRAEQFRRVSGRFLAESLLGERPDITADRVRNPEADNPEGDR